ncbi:MAG: LacI family DNA-binding transcriptional regulator [Ignavibacteriales bacterium]|nr:LacI family DNA-binding transcriptional regulator [Ignavibacteriales bacterium]
MAKKRTKISDIAKRLGVSTALVSFVLNGKSKEKRISDEMSKKVVETAKKMSYKPNSLAKGLRTGKSNTIGLILADISNPYFAKLARFIEIEATKYNYRVIFSNSDEDNEKFATQLEVLIDEHVDGFILTPPIGSEKELISLQKREIPFVIIDRVFKNVKSHSVIIDNFQSGYHATKRLIKNNRKNIAVVNVNNQLSIMRQRVEGYKKALIDSNIDVDTNLIKNLKFSHEKKLVMNAIQDLILKNADAILFTTNKLGVLGIECLRELGKKIPNDFAIISFDDTDAYKVACTPISAIVQPVETMSKEAIRILQKMIEGNYVHGKYENIMLDVDFVFRESCK